MRREHFAARLLRAISGQTQGKFAQEVGVHSSFIAQIELGLESPSPTLLARMAVKVDLTPERADEILQIIEAYRHPLGSQEVRECLTPLQERLESFINRAERRLRTLPAPSPTASQIDRLAERLLSLEPEVALAVVTVAEEFQSWALCAKLCAASAEATSRDLEQAAALAKLAEEIAQRVEGPEGWRNRLRGYAMGHVANVLRVSGELDAADSDLLEAKRLWNSGLDPDDLLDPGRLLELEASLRRDQRRFFDALSLLADCLAMSKHKGRVLIVKGFTLEVMGKYEDAVVTLLQAEPMSEVQNDPRLLYMARFNLAVNFTHLGRYDEALPLLHQVRVGAVQRGDQNELIRVTWLEGRIAAGLGHSAEALRLLEDSRKAFILRNMVADAALALLEEAAILLDAGQVAEARSLAQELSPVLKDKGLHREALVALALFKEAADRETATAELTRRVLRFLFRAQYDQGLQFQEAA